MDDVRALLSARLAETRARLAALEQDHAGMVAASLDSNADDEHDPEGSTIGFERSQLDALARAARHELGEVEAASTRWEDGSYGRCEACGGPIAEARLRARPTARTCVACASRRTH